MVRRAWPSIKEGQMWWFRYVRKYSSKGSLENKGYLD